MKVVDDCTNYNPIGCTAANSNALTRAALANVSTACGARVVRASAIKLEAQARSRRAKRSARS